MRRKNKGIIPSQERHHQVTSQYLILETLEGKRLIINHSAVSRVERSPNSNTAGTNNSMRGCDYTGPPSGSPLTPELSFADDLRASAAVLMASIWQECLSVAGLLPPNTGSPTCNCFIGIKKRVVTTLNLDSHQSYSNFSVRGQVQNGLESFRYAFSTCTSLYNEKARRGERDLVKTKPPAKKQLTA
ncbi:hypothetical protein Q8A67_022354 [Cirrhinus molitorella]|uniref:Uncharacterized protein n=1 Tax=Cirrhinus molitorella TaxID=172907 RepID=A0AA88P8N4_9TELE|nr:hypothetical protein Q8A67_022354 [Cirrhinus molitorella]